MLEGERIHAPKWNNKREDARAGGYASQAGGRGNLHKQVAVNNCLCEELHPARLEEEAGMMEGGGKGGNP